MQNYYNATQLGASQGLNISYMISDMIYPFNCELATIIRDAGHAATCLHLLVQFHEQVLVLPLPPPPLPGAHANVAVIRLSGVSVLLQTM